MRPIERYYSQCSTHMRTRRLFRGSTLAPDGAKTTYVGGVSASQAQFIDADIAYVQARRPYLHP